MRVTTVRFGAPRSQAAGCLIRLQLPPSPSTRAGGAQRPPPPGERNEKVREVTQGGKRVLAIAARVLARERARRVPRSMALRCRALRAVMGNSTATIPSWVFGHGTRSAGAWALGSSGGFLRGVSVELPGAAGTRPGLGRGPSLLPAGGLGLPRGPLAGPSTDGGPSSRGKRPVPAPGTSQRWMWLLGSPDGSSSFLAFRARERAGFVWAWTVLGLAGPPPG